MDLGGDWRRLPWYLRHRSAPRLASRVRRLDALATHRHCTVRIPPGVHIGPGFSLEIPGPGTLVVGERCSFRRGFVAEVNGHGRLTIGAGSIFTDHTRVGCTTSVTIGERCMFGQSILIMDGFHRFRDPDLHLLDQGYDFRPVHIGDGATLLAKVTVTADIGERSVIAAHSVVTRPVPAYCFAAGSPARVIEYFGPPELRPAELDA
jgi:acetyltransferase-like isoleucine patch superfamily enzyme